MKDKAEKSVIARCYTPSSEAFKIELPVEKTWLGIIISIKCFKLVMLPSD
jgi:hypothetical protein